MGHCIARYFNGKNASGTPVVLLIGGVFLIGYTLSYQSECGKNDFSVGNSRLTDTLFISAPSSPLEASQEPRTLDSDRTRNIDSRRCPRRMGSCFIDCYREMWKVGFNMICQLWTYAPTSQTRCEPHLPR